MHAAAGRVLNYWCDTKVCSDTVKPWLEVVFDDVELVNGDAVLVRVEVEAHEAVVAGDWRNLFRSGVVESSVSVIYGVGPDLLVSPGFDCAFVAADWDDAVPS